MLRAFTNGHRHFFKKGSRSDNGQALVAILGALALFVICSLSLGYLKARAPACWGTVEEVNTRWQVPFDSRLTLSARYVFVSVTGSGAAIGLQPGDVVDMTRWTLQERLAFAYPAAGQSSKFAYQRGQLTLRSKSSAASVIPEIDRSRISDVTFRLLILCSGLLIIRYCHGLAALAAGIYLASAGMADSPVMTFAGLPAPVQIGGLVIATGSRLVAYGARFVFAMQLLTPSRPMARAMCFPFVALLLLLLVCDVGRVAGLLIGTPPIPYSSVVLPVAQIVMQAYSIAVFAAAALLAPSAQRFAVSMVFTATFFTVASYVIQECLLVTGQTAPAWAHWYFNSGLLFVSIGYPWAIFARRIAGVDFIISRGVAYAIAIGSTVVAVNLLATVLEQVASGWIEGIMLNYGMPVVLGLSLNWMQDRFTLLLRVLLDHDVRRATRALNRLRAEMVGTPDIGHMSDRICRAIAHSFRATQVAVYGECGGSLHALAGRSAFSAGKISPLPKIPMEDPAFRDMRERLVSVELDGLESVLNGGLVIPLLVMGRLVGALHCGARAYEESYDPAQRTILEHFARELALALACLDPGSSFGDGPAVGRAESRPADSGSA